MPITEPNPADHRSTLRAPEDFDAFWAATLVQARGRASCEAPAMLF